MSSGSCRGPRLDELHTNVPKTYGLHFLSKHMGLKIRGESAWPVFFGFAEHKTFVEYFGITEFAKPQTKTRSGLSISIYPSTVQRLGEGEWEK
jgi:hypothetical protein